MSQLSQYFSYASPCWPTCSRSNRHHARPHNEGRLHLDLASRDVLGVYGTRPFPLK